MIHSLINQEYICWSKWRFSLTFLLYFLSYLTRFWMYSSPRNETDKFLYIYFILSISFTNIFMVFISDFFSIWPSSTLMVGCGVVARGGGSNTCNAGSRLEASGFSVFFYSPFCGSFSFFYAWSKESLSSSF